jgi:hypothetical protein
LPGCCCVCIFVFCRKTRRDCRQVGTA